MIDNHGKKVIAWRITSTVITTLLGRIWFGDWHVTLFGLFLAFFMTSVHYVFERIWNWRVKDEIKIKTKKASS
jgi:uncharacterized membrane protein